MHIAGCRFQLACVRNVRMMLKDKVQNVVKKRRLTVLLNDTKEVGIIVRLRGEKGEGRGRRAIWFRTHWVK